MNRLGVVAAVALAIGWPGGAMVALAQDRAGCRDHPVVSRYAGSAILDCVTVAFDEAAFPAATLTGNVARDRAAALRASGKITAIVYRVPEGTTAAQVAANYRSALIAAGFDILVEHSGRYGTVAKVLAGPRADGAVQSDRYLLARRRSPEGTVYVSLGTGLDQRARSRVGVDLRVVEAQAVTTGEVSARPAQPPQ